MIITTISIITLLIQLLICFFYFKPIFYDYIDEKKIKSIPIKNIALPSFFMFSLYFITKISQENISEKLNFLNNLGNYLSCLLVSFLAFFSFKIYNKNFVINKKTLDIEQEALDVSNIIKKLEPLFPNLKRFEFISDDLTIETFKQNLKEKKLIINFGGSEIYYFHESLNIKSTLENFISYFKNKKGTEFKYSSVKNAKNKILNDSKEKIDEILKIKSITK